MALTLATAGRNAAASGFGTALNSGKLKIYTSGGSASGTLLATFSFAATAFGTAATGTITAAGFPQTVAAAASGTAAAYELYASDGTTLVGSGTVTMTSGGGDITVDNTNIATGQNITLNSFTHTQPA